MHDVEVEKCSSTGFRDEGEGRGPVNDLADHGPPGLHAAIKELYVNA